MILLNEKRFAEECITSGLNGQKPYFVLSLLARYYYHACGCKKKEIKEKLTEYLKKYYPRYEIDEYDWEEAIDKLAGKAGKYPLYEIDGVSIKVSEMETIRKINDKVLERLAFTMLCIAKLNNRKRERNNGWITTDSADLFNYARITCSAYERELKICMLYKMGLLELPKRLDNLNIRVAFICDSGDEALFVSDFRELGYEYQLYRGKNYVRCAECGILIKGNKNGTKKYCNNCAAYTPKEIREVYCVDCGKKFVVGPKSGRSIRCADCQSRIRKEKKRQWARKNLLQN